MCTARSSTISQENKGPKLALQGMRASSNPPIPPKKLARAAQEVVPLGAGAKEALAHGGCREFGVSVFRVPMLWVF